jgi:hypothetical protein
MDEDESQPDAKHTEPAISEQDEPVSQSYLHSDLLTNIVKMEALSQ